MWKRCVIQHFRGVNPDVLDVDERFENIQMMHTVWMLMLSGDTRLGLIHFQAPRKNAWDSRFVSLDPMLTGLPTVVFHNLDFRL